MVSLGRVFGRELPCLGDLIPVDLRAIAARRGLDGFGPFPIAAGPHRLIHGARIMRLRGRHGGVLPRTRIPLGCLGGGNGLLRRAADGLLGRPLTGLVLRGVAVRGCRLRNPRRLRLVAARDASVPGRRERGHA